METFSYIHVNGILHVFVCKWDFIELVVSTCLYADRYCTYFECAMNDLRKRILLFIVYNLCTYTKDAVVESA